MLAYQLQHIQYTLHTSTHTHTYRMVRRKLVLKSERAESGSWTTYKVRPLVFRVYFVNVISVESTDIATTQMVLN